MSAALPSSPACLRNREPILHAITPLLAGRNTVLEIGSGTGQHAAWFLPRLPHIQWQATSLPEDLQGLDGWLRSTGMDIPPPLALDVNEPIQWPAGPFDAAFTANTCHIMAWSSVQSMFTGVARVLAPGGIFIVYGPFMRSGVHTGEGNRRFDRSLRERDPASGIRDIDDLVAEGQRLGMQLKDVLSMPADNRILVWQIDA